MTSVEGVKVYLEQRVEELEKKVAELTEALAGMKQNITLTSPDGTSKICLSASDYCAGIWMTRGVGEPQVAIYNEKNQGAVVGIWGESDDEGYRRGGLDVAMSHNLTDGATIQMIDTDNNVHNFTPEKAGEGVHLSTRSKF